MYTQLACVKVVNKTTLVWVLELACDGVWYLLCVGNSSQLACMHTPVTRGQLICGRYSRATLSLCVIVTDLIFLCCLIVINATALL